MTDYTVIHDLLYRNDRFSLKRAETMLTNHLYSHFRSPLSNRELAEDFSWLSQIEWRRKNFPKALQYGLNAVTILDSTDDIEALVRNQLGVAYVYVKLNQFTEAQDLIVEANALAGGICGDDFRQEVRETSNDVLRMIQRQRQN